MGNAGRKAKVMKIDGEVFKLSTPAKAGDIIKDYPGHVLIDSDEFLRFNLRAPPLDPDSDLRPRKIYLLVDLPRFPAPEEDDGPVFRRTGSGRVEIFVTRRSISDLRIAGGLETDDRRRLTVRLPKAEVERIVEQSEDEVETAKRIIDLCAAENAAEGSAPADSPAAEGGSEEDETTEEVSFGKYCVNFYSACSPIVTRHRPKYKKLMKG